MRKVLHQKLVNLCLEKITVSELNDETTRKLLSFIIRRHRKALVQLEQQYQKDLSTVEYLKFNVTNSDKLPKEK